MSSVSEAYKIVEREKLSKTMLFHHKSLIAFADYIELAIRCDLVWLFFKSHICEEGGAHLRISFRHTLINSEKPKKSDFWKNEKKLLQVSWFYTCAPKTTIIWGTVPEIQSKTEYFVILGHLNNPEKQNFEKMKKTSGYCIILNLCNQKHDHMTHA